MVFEKMRGIKGLKKKKKSYGAIHQEKRQFYEKIQKILQKIVLALFVLVFLVAVAISVYAYKIYQDLPDIDSKMNVYIPNEATQIISKDGVVLAKLHREENRTLVPLSKISDNIKKAIVAVEDKRFYKHHGVDWIGIFRAIAIDIKDRSPSQGASTLTQQLVKNVFLYKEKSIKRKIAEVMLSTKIERYHSKEEILEMYLNEVYWGHNAYGIESASQLYYGKSSQTLTLAESALLVGILRGPEIYSPYKNYDQAILREKIVLVRMLQLGYISKREYDEALKQPIILKGYTNSAYKAPYFVSYIIEQLIKDYGEASVYVTGMKVYTTLDYRLQRIAERVVEETVLAGKEGKAGFDQAAMLVMDPETGHIVAMVGGYDFTKSQFNKAVHSYRQPGSAFKPITYLTALERGMTPDSIIVDAPVSYGSYVPQNYNHDYKGSISLKKALELSQNIPAVKLCYKVGPQAVIDTARRLGIKSPLQPYLPLTLGANELTMLELTSAYCVFAAQGIKTDPISITKVQYHDHINIQVNRVRRHQEFSKEAVNQLVDMMQNVVENGTAKAARLVDRPVAGKTGTTSDYRDAWFMGFVPQLVVATWVGNDNNSRMNRVTGGSYPAKMWKSFMEKALSTVPVKNFPLAESAKKVNICELSGELAAEYCPSESVKEKYFVKEFMPTKECTLHKPEAEKQNVPLSPKEQQEINATNQLEDAPVEINNEEDNQNATAPINSSTFQRNNDYFNEHRGNGPND
ncbi:MAG: penicillin-binding protein [Candidatus Margulisiibacteriota bacterium]|nr:MAG: hypothetical protein A2X43_01490 [Candidatus Margulisbacteria bacterium GWD2_39_127]OGI04540.1 MAG: hypothetical protein A2X42_10455 [Candidatus Margulisbacteria bacterium GWF2_38_17]OGI07105.1 MAG: hypothetical protein A2X41_12725 [Candidatus Margulisbacteria bacterium GWE2_39_32]PZM82255.1 MAG: penicillin-binding protein [Candidatus Margulisiibacteriota bacterium]HAR62999.1 penicillin-binding protein [Candidatus Margulisiibacteriota bacterium]